ncbi:2-octaprenyl-6-methoxyphenyl hydroxylase [Thalassotalea ganghwensis]
MASAAQHFDIVIAGGGLSGALSAIALSQCKKPDGQCLSIAIIDKHPLQQRPELTFDDRVLALSHASVQYFKRLDVWSLLASDSQPIEDIHISDRGYYGKARVSAESHQVSALGYVAPMAAIGAAMLERLKHCQHVSWFTPEAIEDIHWTTQQVCLTLSSGKQLTGSLLLGCDGAQSQCRHAANIAIREKPYQQAALIANVVTSKPHNNIAFERFTEHGPIAMLPLSELDGVENRCSLVWTLPPSQAEKIKRLSASRFNQELNRAFGFWLGAIKKVGERHVYPLNLVQAQEQVNHRLVLIGNASHTIHPIAGQGFNLGLRDVADLVCAIEQALSDNRDIGQLSVLMAYAQKRQQDHRHIIQLTDSLVSIFSNHYDPLVIGRNIGLKVMNYVSPLKQRFVNKTMGY